MGAVKDRPRRKSVKTTNIAGAIMQAAFAYYEATGDMMREIAIPEEHYNDLTRELGYSPTRSSLPPAQIDEEGPIRSALDVSRVHREVAIRVNGIYVWPSRRKM